MRTSIALMSYTWKQYVGHRAREMMTHASRWSQRRSLPRLVILPCGGRSLGSSDLRAWRIGGELRRLGWRVTVVPAQCELEQRLRIIRWEKPDLILIQKGRHPYNWPHHYSNKLLVFDLDDADFLDDRQAKQLAACCTASRAVIAGSRYIAEWCSRYNPNVTVVWTGGLMPAHPPTPPAGRRPVLTWASSDAPGYPADADLVRSLVRKLAESTAFEFRLYGARRSWDPQFLQQFMELPVPVVTVPFMRHDRLVRSMSEVAVGLNPIPLEFGYNLGKSFGKVLPYLAAKVAVVASNALEMPQFFRHGENGFLADGFDDWVECTRKLLTDPGLRERIAENGFGDFRDRLTTASAARKIDRILREVLHGVTSTASAR